MYQSRRDPGHFQDLTRNVGEERSSLSLTLGLLTLVALVCLLITPVAAIPPVAGFTMNPSSGRGYAPLTVYFTDTSTGSVGAWWWEFGDGATSTAQNPMHQYPYTGTYTVTLSVFPFGGGVMLNPSEMTKTVTVILRPKPTLVLSPSSGRPGTHVTAYGSNFDVSGLEFAQADILFNGKEIVSNVWFTGSGFTTSFVVPEGTSPGSYTVQATGGRDAVTTTFTVTNTAPRARIDANPLSGKSPLSVHFSGIRSYDEDGSISSYGWNFGDNTFATGSTADHTYTRPGHYTATLTVTGNLGGTGIATVTLNIENVPPVAVARAYPTSGSDPLTVDFDGSQSYDPDGTITSYYWNFGDGTWERTARAQRVYRDLQSYTAVLTVTDDWGMTAKDEVVITVGNEPPVAILAVSTQKGTRPLSVTFNSLQSYDPDDTDLTYTWDFGDGTSGSGITTRHTYEKEGTYLLSLLVMDPHGASDTAQATVRVESPFPWWLGLIAVVFLGGTFMLRHFRKPGGTVVAEPLPSDCRIPEPEVHVEVRSGIELPNGIKRKSDELPDISVEVRSGIWKKGDHK